MKTTTPTKLLTGQWGAAMNYIETHKPVLINSRDHHDIVMLLATDYEEMKQKCEALEHELTIESENHKEALGEIESCDCMGEVSKVLRMYGR